MRAVCLVIVLATALAPAQRLEDWFVQQRVYPSGTLPEKALENALLQRAALESQLRAEGGAFTARPAQDAPFAPSPTWTQLGPNGINTAEGPVSGRVTALVTDSRNPDHVYLAAAGGGVWRSSDSGATWQSLGDNLLSLSSGALVLDERIGALYYGTGDFSSGAYGAGVLRSTDGGATWQQLSAQFNQGATLRLVLHPQDPRTLLVARSSGVWRSTDGGDTWVRLLAGFASDLVIDVNDPRLLFAALGRAAGAAENGVYRSLDGGNTWALVNSLPPGLGVGRISLAESTANPAVVYALVSRSSNYSLEGLYRSDDFGGSWRRLNNAPVNLFLNGNAHQGNFDNMIVLDPRTPERIYLGGSELYRSTDGGLSWTNLSVRGGQRVIHEDFFAVAFKPNNPDFIYVGCDGGIYRSGDGGDTWTSLNRALPITQFNAVAVPPAGGVTFLGGTQDNGVIRLIGDASTWDQILRGDGGDVLFDPTNSNVLLAARPELQFMRSQDGGGNWSPMTQGLPANERAGFYPPLVMDAANSRHLLLGSYRVWRSTNGGDSWAAISADLTGGGVLTALAIAPNSFLTYFAATSDGRVYSSVDGGLSWRAANGAPNRWITSLAVDPRASFRAYLTASGFGSGHVFRTQDNGLSWQDISGNLPDAPASAVVVDPRGPVYVATDVGVFRSEDGGGSWSSFNLGLPNSFVTALAMDAGATILVAGTYGRAAYAAIPRAPQTGPNVLARGVVNAASFSTVLAPGAIASIYGSGLASATVNNTTIPIATTLANTTVTVNGVAAPLFFVSPQQINFQTPFEITASSATVVVTTPDGSAAALVQIAPASPGIFAGTVSHANGRAVDASNPATTGEVITLFASGLGATSPAVATGAASPSSPPAQVLPGLRFGATIAGTQAVVQFAGLAPGYVGLDQVNLTIPAGISGDAAIVLSSGGRSSNAVTIPVR